MLQQLLAPIIEWLRTTIIIGLIFYPIRIYILRRKVVVSEQNCNLCQKLHEALNRLIANPQNRVLKAYIACLEADLRNRTYTNARSRIGREVENTLRPCIRHSMVQYEKEKSYENYKRLRAGLSPVLFRRPPAILDQSLSLKCQYEFAKECTQELAWIYVFHSNQARDFIEESPILRFLPYKVKERIHR